jgi:hypothetical protein
MATYIGNDGMKNFSAIDQPKEGTPSVPSTETPFLGSNLLLQWAEGIKRYGLQRTIVQAYTVKPSYDLYWSLLKTCRFCSFRSPLLNFMPVFVLIPDGKH